MFSKGQITFAIIFTIVFLILLAYTYRKDFELHKRHYKGTLWVLLAFIAFIGFIAVIKFIFMG